MSPISGRTCSLPYLSRYHFKNDDARYDNHWKWDNPPSPPSTLTGLLPAKKCRSIYISLTCEGFPCSNSSLTLCKASSPIGNMDSKSPFHGGWLPGIYQTNSTGERTDCATFCLEESAPSSFCLSQLQLTYRYTYISHWGCLPQNKDWLLWYVCVCVCSYNVLSLFLVLFHFFGTLQCYTYIIHVYTFTHIHICSCTCTCSIYSIMYYMYMFITYYVQFLLEFYLKVHSKH